jgi:hypothetical protein
MTPPIPVQCVSQARPERAVLRRRVAAFWLLIALAGPSAAETGPADAVPPAAAAGTTVALATAPAPAMLRPLSERGRELAPEVLAAMPHCAAFDPPSAAEFHGRIFAMCTAVAGRIQAGTAANVVDVYAAIQLKDYREAIAGLAAGDGEAEAARRISDTAAYLIARQLKLFEIYRAMAGRAE